jgi:hypothetical protein
MNQRLHLAFLALMVAAATASIINTESSSLGQGVADRIAEYAADNGGRLPEDWNDLGGYIDFDRLKANLRGAAIDQKIKLFSGNGPFIEGAESGRLVAMTAFPIHEDRRSSIGRYIVFQKADGSIGFRWESEEIIQRAVVKAGASVPVTAVHEEDLFKPLEFEYGARLLKDAMAQGVSADEAQAVLAKHIDDVSKRRVRPAITWAEVLHPVPLPVTPASALSPPPDQRISPATKRSEVDMLISHRWRIIWGSILGLIAVTIGWMFVRRRRPRSG